MKLLYDDELVEAVVLACATAKRKSTAWRLVQRFERDRDKLYQIEDVDERNAAFARLHLEWFREWGYEDLLRAIVGRFSILDDSLRVLAFRKARSRHEEGSELYVDETGDRKGVIALRAERFAGKSDLEPFLNHELQHLSDMVDPAFGYSPVIRGAPASQERLVRERYRLLWDVTIDGRLLASGHPTTGTRELREKEFHRAHSFLPEEKRGEIFESLWSNGSPKHEELMSLATDPRGVSETRRATPGGLCALCGFPTFHWADISTLPGDILDRIQSEFPAWTPVCGICRRCIEVYEAARFLEPGVA